MSLGIVGNLSMRRGTQTLFRDVWTDAVKVMEFESFYELEN